MAILASAVLLAACGGSSSSSGGSTDSTGETGGGGSTGGGEGSSGSDSKIVIADLEGSLATGGPEFTKGLKIAEKRINEEGGVMGHEVEVRVFKAGSTSQESVEAYRNASSEADIVGAWIGGNGGLSIKAQASSIGLPILMAVGNQEAVEPVDAYTFQVSFGGQYATSSVNWGVANHQIKKIGILHYETDFSNGLTPAIEAACEEELGCEVTVAEKANAEASVEELVPQLTALKNSGAEGYYIESLNPNGPKAARQLGMFDKPVMTEQWLTVPGIAEAAGPAAEGMVFGGGKCRAPEVLLKNDPARAFCENYLKEFEALYPGEEFGLYSQYGNDTVSLYAKAAERILKAGEEVNRETMQKSLQEFSAAEEFRTSQGIIESSETDHALVGEWNEAYVDYEIHDKNGKLEYVLAKGANPAGATAEEGEKLWNE